MPAPAEAALFVLPIARVIEAQAKVAKFAKKAAKLGLPVPSLRVVCEYESTTFVNERGQLSRGHLDDRIGATINHVEGFAPVLPSAPRIVSHYALADDFDERPIIRGWEFAATIEHTHAGNFVWTVPGIDVPTAYREGSSRVCDHCGYSRNRSKTYALRNVETGEFMRVGSSCLQDHLGHAGADVWMNCFQWLREASERDEDEGSYGGGALTSLSVGVVAFIAAVVAFVGEYGFTSKARATDRNPSTAGEVYQLLSDPKKGSKLLAELTPNQFAKAREILAWLAEQDDDSGFVYNAQLAAKLEIVTHKTAGVLAAVVPSFDRDLVKDSTKLNEHAPVNVGERYVLDLTFERRTGYETDFGWTSIFLFRDAQGRAFKWKTSSEPAIIGDEDNDGLEVGKAYRVLAGIKAFDEYKGAKQTELTRAKLHVEGCDEPKLRSAKRKLCKQRGETVPVWAMTDKQRAKAAKAAA